MGLVKSCKETSLLVTQSLDRKLNLRERFDVWLHLAICGNCVCFNQHMQQIRECLRNEDAVTMQGTLKDSARERIARKLQEKE